MKHNNRNDKFIDRIKANVPSILAALVLFPIAEKLLTPLYNVAADKILSAKNIGIRLISSFVYSRISEGVYINISFYIFIILISLLISFLLLIIVFPYKKANSCCDADSISQCRKRKSLNSITKMRCLFFNPQLRKKVVEFCSILLYFIFALFVLTTNFINDTITQTTNNIEIISPYITDTEYKMLKSKFYSMGSRTDFDELTIQLNEYSSKYGVKLK